MNKREEYLKFYIDSNANIDTINKYIKNEGITLNEFNDIVTNYLKELDRSKKINKLYLEYCLKYGNKKIGEKRQISKRKETETVINIINNYIKEDNHDIKDYINNSSLTYSDFKKFINSYDNYYLTDKEKSILKSFFKRENDFNKNNIDKVKIVVDKISDDLVNDKIYDIFDYYKELGWNSNLLINYLKNNKDVFSNFVIDNTKIYLKKYHINDINYKLNDFLDYIKKNNKDLDIKKIESIINYMNNNKMPYNYYLFKCILEKNIINE